MSNLSQIKSQDQDAARRLADAIGRKKMAASLSVGETAVSNAVVRGWFPSSWFHAASKLASEIGEDCPPELFGMKPLSNTQFVNETGFRQVNQKENTIGRKVLCGGSSGKQDDGAK